MSKQSLTHLQRQYVKWSKYWQQAKKPEVKAKHLKSMQLLGDFLAKSKTYEKD